MSASAATIPCDGTSVSHLNLPHVSCRSLCMVTDDRQRDAIVRAAGEIADADALLVTAGAGMGVDSGLPDFRSAGGFWRTYPRLGQLGISFEQMAQPSWFRDDPAMAWAFYGHRQALYRRT